MFRILIICFFISFSIKADQYDIRLDNLFKQLLDTDNELEIKNQTGS